MRRIHRTIQQLVACGIALAMLGVANSSFAEMHGSEMRAAKVIRVKGNAQYAPDGHTWGPVTVGDMVMPGGAIRTSEKSEVDLRLGEAPATHWRPSIAGNPAAATVYVPEQADVNLVRVEENSLLAIDKLSETGTGLDKVSDTQLNLKQGKILGNVKKLSAASRYEVKLPNGVAGIRGSSYLIGADGSVTMITGSAVISLIVQVPGGGAAVTQTFTIDAGQVFDPIVAINAVNNAAAGQSTAQAKVQAAQAALASLANAQVGQPGSGGAVTIIPPILLAGLEGAIGQLGAGGGTTTTVTAGGTVIVVSPTPTSKP